MYIPVSLRSHHHTKSQTDLLRVALLLGLRSLASSSAGITDVRRARLSVVVALERSLLRFAFLNLCLWCTLSRGIDVRCERRGGVGCFALAGSFAGERVFG